MSGSLPGASPESVYVVGLGASTPVGRDPLSSTVAVQAGITGLREHPFMIDTTGKPMVVAPAPWLDVDLEGQDRFEALLFPAVEQALASIEAARSPALRVALALGLPARPTLPENLSSGLLSSVARRFERCFTGLATFEIGHAAGFIGLHAAMSGMAAGAFDACVIAGVESYFAPEALQWLEENEQVHGAGPLNNAWGFVPGEAAGAALLAVERAVDRLEVEPLARVLSVGRGYEPNKIKTQTVCIGEGLAAAFREGLAGLPHGAKVTDIICDMNGEPYRADEFGFATLRTKDVFASAADFVAPADCWGDVSAASAPLFIMLSTMAARNAYANGPYAFLWASSESGERGAALLLVPEYQRD